MDKMACAEAFIFLNKNFASKYQEAWVKIFRKDDSLSMQWIQAFVDDGVDSNMVEKVIDKVKVDERYADYPPNLNAFMYLVTSIKFSNILDDEDAYLHFCTNRSVADIESLFLISKTVRAIGAHRLRTTPSLIGSFKKIYNKNKSLFVSGELQSDYDFFINENKKTSNSTSYGDTTGRVVEKPENVVDRLKRISDMIKK